MKNLSSFEKFYEKSNNPLESDNNLDLIVKAYLTTDSQDSYYQKMVGDNYKKFKCGLKNEQGVENYLLKEDGKWLYYFGGDQFYPEYEMYKNDVRHQLYISAGYEMLDSIKTDFIKFCCKNEIPFCLKVCNDKRNDNLVLYATDSNFFYYLEALKNYSKSFKLNNPFCQRSDMLKAKYTPDVTGLLEPPILTSKICKWIGYGSGKAEESYVENRVKYLKQIIPEVLEEYSIQEIEKYNELKSRTKLLTDLKRYVIETSEQANIDPNNFAFNLDVAEEINSGKKLVK